MVRLVLSATKEIMSYLTTQLTVVKAVILSSLSDFL